MKNFREIFDKLNIEHQFDLSFSELTTFKTGGNASVVLFPKNADEVREAVSICKESETQFFVLGNGSNVLASDKGYDGAIISTEKLSSVRVLPNDEIFCEAGAMLKKLCKTALDSSLTGAEFAWGIPGTVGGAVFMNAGAYGEEIKMIIKECTFLDSDGEVKTYSADKLDLSYRKSLFSENGGIILSAVFSLEKGDRAQIKAKMDDLLSRRKDKQPLEYPSAGSTFKRPKGHFAGALIEQSGLRGLSVGGAEVSDKHCGFIINKNNATSDDIQGLIDLVKEKVLEKTGVTLECEVIFLGN